MAFKGPRWTLANVLPVGFILCVVGTIWGLYVWLHLFSLLQVGAEEHEVDPGRRHRGMVQTAISQVLSMLFMICFMRAICTDPGSVPEGKDWVPDKRTLRMKWMSSQDGTEADRLLPVQHEAKLAGGRRFCKWCNHHKPDRCHHCRVCRSCILRMDHHCPWIANCVGFRNHKFFFLLVFYAAVTCGFIVCTMSESWCDVLYGETSQTHRFLTVFGMTLTVTIGILLQLFFTFHVRLMLVATTTIEFCEKRNRYGSGGRLLSMPDYRTGLLEDVRAVLGPCTLCWFLPIMPPTGEGLSFPARGDGGTVARARRGVSDDDFSSDGASESSALLGYQRRARAKDSGSETDRVAGAGAAPSPKHSASPKNSPRSPRRSRRPGQGQPQALDPHAPEVTGHQASAV